MLRSAVTAFSASMFLLLAGSAAAQSRRVSLPNPSGVPPGGSLVGQWHSSLPAHATVHVWATGESTLVAMTPGVFHAECFIEGATIVGLARFGSPVSPGTGDWVRYRLLRASWSGPAMLQVTWVSPLTGEAQSEETWRYGERGDPGSHAGPAAGGADSLPRLGDFVYVETLPEPIERVPPDYPSWARGKGVEGTVMVQALVGKDGLVKDARVVRSIPMLDDYAVAAVKQWRFKPAMSKGVPVPVWVGIPVKFTLR
jgi:TonB family protein